MIDQNNLKSDIESFLSEFGSDSFETTAAFFASAYHKHVGKVASDQFGNIPIRSEGSWDGAWGNKNRKDRKQNDDATMEGVVDPP